MIYPDLQKHRIKFQQYITEWTKRGLTTKRKSQEDAYRDFMNFQRFVMKKEKCTPVMIFDSPSKCWEMILRAEKIRNVTRCVVDNNAGSIYMNWYRVLVQTGNCAWYQVDGHFLESLIVSVRDRVWEQLRNLCKIQLDDAVFGKKLDIRILPANTWRPPFQFMNFSEMKSA